MMKKNSGIRVASAFLVVMLLLEHIMPISIHAIGDEEKSTAPNADNCVLYNYKTSEGENNGLVPTLYMWNLAGEAAYRVYKTALGDDLIGTGTYNSQSKSCTVPLAPKDLLDEYEWDGGGTVYVSRQEAGKAESDRVAVKYNASRTPSVNFEVFDIRKQAVEGTQLITPQSKNAKCSTPNRMTAGSYYVVDVVLQNFTKLQSITLPIKYDPTVLELTSLGQNTVSGIRGYGIGSAVSAPDGAFISPFMITNVSGAAVGASGNPSYGICTYTDLLNWGVSQDTSGTSQWRQTPYVNTSTGLIKLEFSGDDVVDLTTLANENGSTTNARRILRLYFKCLKTGTGTWGEQGSPLYFASMADVPDGVTDLAEQQKYCNIAHPDGWEASIGTLNIMAPPLSVKLAGLSAEDLVVSVEKFESMPEENLTFDERVKKLLENTVRVYNYTNHTDEEGEYEPGLLDFGINDCLVLSPSNTESGAAKIGDRISVYLPNPSGGDEKIVDRELVDNEGGIAIDLGTSHLDPKGGILKLTVTRGGTTNGVESAKVEIPYEAEMGRNVYFDLHSSGYTGGTIGNLHSDYEVKAGDQLKLDIYFNNFSDLLSYTFKMNFNQSVIQAADSGFHKLEQDGYISASAYMEGTSCLEAGADMKDAPTMNERNAYNAYEEYLKGKLSEAEAMEIMDSNLEASITSVMEMEQAANEIKPKIAFDDGTGRWEGGLLFTGPVRAPGTNGESDPGRDENAIYPYVSNYTGELRFASANLVSPPLTINKTGLDENGELTHGYHFLSVYFTAVTSGPIDLTINGASARNYGTERVNSIDGTELVLSGPGRDLTTVSTPCALPFEAHWSISGKETIEKNAIINLYQGNSGTGTDLYLYEGYTYRDPGLFVQDSRDRTIVNSNGTQLKDDDWAVKRTVVRTSDIAESDDDKAHFELPAWEKDESLLTDKDGKECFNIPEGQFSAEYTITYAYTEEADPNDPTSEPETVYATRKVYVLRRKGDYNGDGEVNFFDLMVNISDASGDLLFENYTRIDDPTELRTKILKRNQNDTEPLYPMEFTMPVPMADPEPDGNGSDAPEALKYSIKFYAADAVPGVSAPLEPAELPAGEQVIMAVMYENLSGMCNDGGFSNTAFAISYDSDIFTIDGFTDDLGDGAYGMMDDADSLNLEWVLAYEADEGYLESISRNASDISIDEHTRRVYIHYVDEEEALLPDNYVWYQPTGCLAAFKFTVKNETFTDAAFDWLDYGMALYNDDADLVNYDKHALLDGVNLFQKPERVLTSGEEELINTFSITGQVVSYNAKNPITYELYKMGDDGQYEGTAAYTGTAVEAEATTTAGKQTQELTIFNVPNGTYKLLIKKQVHLSVTIIGLVINDADVDLTDSGFPAEVRSISMAAGDVDGNGAINVSDAGLVTHPDNFNAQDLSTVPNPNADIDGNNAINVTDEGIITFPDNYNKQESDFVIEL